MGPLLKNIGPASVWLAVAAPRRRMSIHDLAIWFTDETCVSASGSGLRCVIANPCGNTASIIRKPKGFASG